MENKEILRKKILDMRKNLNTLQIKALSHQIFYQIIHWDVYQKAESLFSYLSFGQEVSTEALIDFSLKNSKTIGIPAVRGNEIIPLEFGSWDKLRCGYSGIYEPIEEKPFHLNQNTLIIVPGSVFDREGNRIGYGKGFYDRFLVDQKGIRVGLGFSFQVIEAIEAGSHDIPMDYIITEKEIIKTHPKPLS